MGATGAVCGNAWRLTPGFDPEWREWGDESLLFERFSGDLHLLDSTTAQIIKLLQEGEASAEELTEQLSNKLAILAIEEKAELSSFVRQALQQLSGLWLVVCH